MKKALVALSFLLLPSLTFAAGFAKDSLFLSKSPVTEGETVKIYAVVANSASTAFKGSVVLSDGGQKIASIDVTMDAGATQTTSAVWKPLSGTHTIKAELTSDGGTVVEQESLSVSIAAKPKPASTIFADDQSAAVVGSSNDIQKSIANVSPQVASAAEPLFTVIDSARSGIADVLDSQITNTKESLAKTQNPGLVLGTSTKAIADPIVKNPWGSFWFFLYTVYLYILTAFRWLVGNAGVFYPVLAILFLYILWRIFRRIRRPSY